MSEKAQRLIKGSILQSIYFFASIFVSFYIMPFLVHNLGNRWYGFWAFLTSFIAFFDFFDLGLTTAVSRYISRSIGQNDDEETNTIIVSSFFTFSILSCLVLVATGIVLICTPFFLSNPEEVAVFRVSFLLLGLSFAIDLPCRTFAGILFSHLRQDIHVTLRFVVLSIRTVAIVFFIGRGYSIVMLALITLLVSQLYNFTMLYLTQKMYLWRFSKKYFKSFKIKQLFQYSSFSFLAQLADHLRFNIDYSVIGYYLGAEANTFYAIPSSLCRYFMTLVGCFIGLLTPVFSQYEGKNDYDSIRDKFITMNKISIYLAVSIGLTIICFARPFITVWMGEEYVFVVPYVYILVGFFAIDIAQSPGVRVLYGISKHKYYAFMNFAEGILNLIVSLLLVRKYGLMGVVLGTAIPIFILRIFVQPWIICRCISYPLHTYVKKSIFGVLFVSLPFVSMYYLFHGFVTETYLSVFKYASVINLSVALVSFFVLFNKDERYYFYDFVSKFVNRLK